MSRFNYIRYDERSQAQQAGFKEMFTAIERTVEANFRDSREKSLVLTKLEEAYMWVGKAIRNEQLALRPQADVAQEERSDS